MEKRLWLTLKLTTVTPGKIRERAGEKNDQKYDATKIIHLFLPACLGESEAKRKLKTSFKSPVCGKKRVNKGNQTDIVSIKTEILELENKNKQLDKELDELQNMGISLDSQTQTHTLSLEEGCTTKNLYEEYGLSLDD
ncbi:hypothetical protein LSH36_58g18066 [Paralvinella palmiformis]|uniref:Uncharacterized protein n=1 Tax=Paralvinella palmiformis TaxID=53620 RepID=A0AAD9NCF1_9ANNE|nr:hypothetical protein LSH36_58g18066 [Paralvinella palmiformis]